MCNETKENGTGMVKYVSSLCPTTSTKAPDITWNVAINGGIVDCALMPGSVTSALHVPVYYLILPDLT